MKSQDPDSVILFYFQHITNLLSMDTQNVLEKGRAALLLLSNKILSILNSRVLRGGLSTLIIIDLVAVILQSFSDLSQYRFVFSFITVISGLVFFV